MPRTTPLSLQALGGKPLPTSLTVGGRTYYHRKTFKNDFFAVTTLYEGKAGKVVLKVGRQARFLLLPLKWVGRFLARREEWFLRQLEELDQVPGFMGRWGDTGIVRRYLEGHPLQKGERVDDDFHPRLRALVGEIHRRGMAYVDLEKCENVVVGEDGRPYLIDFQIAWRGRAPGLVELPPLRWLGECLQRGDRYHLVKLQRRTRPDQLSKEELQASYHRPWYVQLHRVLTALLQWVRRSVLERVDPRRGPGERGSVPDDDTLGVT